MCHINKQLVPLPKNLKRRYHFFVKSGTFNPM